MSRLKTEVKAAMLHDVGFKLEDMFEASKIEHAESRGIRSGFDFAARKIEQLSLALDKEAGAEPPKMAPEEFKIAKLWVTQCHAILMDCLKSSTETVFRTQGKVAALEQSVSLLEGLKNVEQRKLEAFAAGTLVEENSGPLPAPPTGAFALANRVEGQHPGNPIAALKARAPDPEPAQVTPPAPPKRRRKKE